MDKKAAPTDISAPSLTPIQPFLGNQLLLLLSLGLLAVLMGVALLYKTYFVPLQKNVTLSPATTKHTSLLPTQQQSSIQEANQTIFAIGGYYKDKATKTTPATNSAEFYDFFSNKWQFAPPMHYSHAAAATAEYNGKIYVFGGQSANIWGGTTTVEMFDPTTSTWTVMSPMLHARFFSQAITLGSKIYILGGLDPEDKSMDIYTPATNSWQPGPVIPMGDIQYTSPRCAVWKDKIYCPSLGDHAYTLEYDPTTNQWQTLATQNRLPTGYFTWTNNDTTLYGLRFSNGNILYQYDPSIDAITAIKTGDYIDKTYQGFRSVAFEDNIFLIGGKFSADPVGDVYILNLQHPTSWQKTSPLNVGRSEPGVVILPNLYSGPNAMPTGGSISGKITTNGNPAAHIRVKLVTTTPDGNIDFGKEAGSTFTNEQGVYIFTALSPAKYRIYVANDQMSKLNNGEGFSVPDYKGKQEYILAKYQQVNDWNYDTTKPY